MAVSASTKWPLCPVCHTEHPPRYECIAVAAKQKEEARQQENTIYPPQVLYSDGTTRDLIPRKHDDEKNRLQLLPVDALEEIGKVLTFGAVKYSEGNWAVGKGFKWSRLFGGLLRHSFAWVRGEDKDPESGLSHLAHAGCMLLFLLAHVLRKHGEDDRVSIGQSRSVS